MSGQSFTSEPQPGHEPDKFSTARSYIVQEAMMALSVTRRIQEVTTRAGTRARAAFYATPEAPVQVSTQQGWAGVALRFPVDIKRGNRPWRQLVIDLLAPAVVDDWYALVAHTRIRYYDQVRLSVTRGSLLTVVAASLAAAPHTSRWAWWVLTPAIAQVSLEIYLDQYTRTNEIPRLRVVRAMTAFVNWSHDKTILNTTGLLGIVACPLNIIAVTFATGPGDPAWVKVVGLTAAVLYTNSGLAGVFLDVPHYSTRQVLPQPLPHMRTAAWAIEIAVIEAIVAVSVRDGKWAAEMVPIAYLCGLLPIALGTRVRDHDRLIGAAAMVAQPAVVAARARLRHDTHDLGNRAKYVAQKIRRIDAVPAQVKVIADEIPPLLSTLEAMVDEEQWARSEGQVGLSVWAEKFARSYGLRLTCNIDWGTVSSSSYDLARHLISTLLLNTGQEVVNDRYGEYDDFVTVTAERANGKLRVSVEDALPLIPAAQWCPPNSTTGLLAERIRDQFGGQLSQVPTTTGKSIVGVWPEVRPGLTIMPIVPEALLDEDTTL